MRTLMKKGWFKRGLAIVTLASLLLGLTAPAAFVGAGQAYAAEGGASTLSAGQTVTASVYYDASTGTVVPAEVPPLLITELLPDSNNYSGSDAYEFVEVFNNTDHPIDFSDYYFYYNNGDKWSMTKEDDVVIIPAKQPVVFWIMNAVNGPKTEEEFISNLNAADAGLKEGVNLFRINGGGGMSNSATRNLQIRTKTGDGIVVSATYEKANVALNMGIFYKHPAAGSHAMTIITPDTATVPATPGKVSADQIQPPPTEPGEGNPEPGAKPEIVHTAPHSVQPSDVEIKAVINNLTAAEGAALPAVQLLYKSASQERYAVSTMSLIAGNEYRGYIPSSVVAEERVDYKIKAADVEESYTLHVELAPFDPAKAPVLLVTELVPDTANVAGSSSDAYEFIEVYNNTDAPINFNNYKVYYRYPDKGISSDAKWPSTKEDFIIPAQQAIVFWIKNGLNDSYTTADFNAFYGTSLVEDQNLFIIESAGMANSGRRSVVIKTNTEVEVSAAYYDAESVYENGTAKEETKVDYALMYKHPVNGSTTMIKASAGLKRPTPGIVDASQVPSVPVHVVPDTVAPTVQDLTAVTEIDQSQNLDLKASAEDDQIITSVQLMLRTDKAPNYVSYNVAQNYNDRLYHHLLSSADLIGRAYIEYYFIVSDGTNVTETDPVKVIITGGPDQSELRLNVKDGEIVSGTKTLKGTAQNEPSANLSISIDGQEIAAADTFAALENDAYFVFDVKGVDYYFKNAITMGPEELKEETILYTFMDPIPSYTTVSFPIPADLLTIGSDNVIYIRAGSKSSPFDERPEENKDDFEIKNVRLLLADGTELRDPLYAEREKEIKMGDSAGKFESLGFRFELPSELFKSKAVAWDTKAVADGEHEVAVNGSAGTKASTVFVDNTAPVISSNMENGKLYRGQFTITADVTDSIAGVSSIEVTLDNKAISLPYTASSGVLASGEHTLAIKAADNAGNKSELTVIFETPNENPLAPELIAPSNGKEQAGTNPALTVKVQDPTDDLLAVTFLKGFKYDGSRAAGFKGYLHASDTEPPKVMIPSGETALTASDYALISEMDGQYLTNDSVEQFPYQRYEIKLDDSVAASDLVVIDWKGHSIEGRKVSLYAWSMASDKWELLDQKIAGTEDFELSASVLAGDYAFDGMIQVMVQDEIAAASAGSKPVTENDYDFTFLWMSDTQYYSQSYPYIYQKNVQWIAENKDAIKLQYVIHTGDIVDKEYQEYQWIEADKNMKVLEDANIPYGVLAGNHDVGHQNNDYTKYWEYFGDWRFKDMQTFGGSYQNNRGHYDLVSAGGNDFIIVYMGWGLADEEIEWMNEIVSQYPERKAILALHEYLLVSGNRAPIADKIYEKVVVPNKNVIAALSGHYHDAQLKVDEIDDNGDGVSDRKVYQMLADYQGAPEGGLGYIRLLQFDIGNNMLHVKTYSPYLDKYNFYDPANYPGKDEFSLELDLQPQTKRVATDYIGVKVYTDQAIGAISDVASGSEATVIWNGLNANSYYEWYVKAEDGNSGSVLSDIWGFYTGEGDGGPTEPTPTPTPQPTPPGGSSGSNNGVLEVSLNDAGEYAPTYAELSKAIAGAAGGKLEIKLLGSNGSAQLALDGEALKLAHDRKLKLEIAANGASVTIPWESLTDAILASDKAALRIDTTLHTSIEGAVNSAIQGDQALSSSGFVFTLTFSIHKDGKSEEIHQFNGPITVARTLAANELSGLDAEYAGVYYLINGKAEYIGGVFANGKIIFTTDHFSQFAVLEYRKQFADLTDSWANEYVQKLAAKHIVKGLDDSRYGPQLAIKRADFAALVVRALGLDSEEAAHNPFNDVPSDAYYAASVAKAAELGLVQGSGGSFRPLDTISREEAAVILMRMAAIMEKDKAASNAGSKFADMSQVSEWAKDAVLNAQAQGIINGKGDGRFDPQGKVTRAEMAKMLYMMLSK